MRNMTMINTYPHVHVCVCMCRFEYVKVLVKGVTGVALTRDWR